MRLNFHLRHRLFNDDRNAFDVLTQFLIGFFHPRFKCMTSAHLMNALNTYFVRPSVCVVQLNGMKRNLKIASFAFAIDENPLTCIRATSISISATISPNSGRISFFVVKHTRHTLSNSNVFISSMMQFCWFVPRWLWMQFYDAMRYYRWSQTVYSCNNSTKDQPTTKKKN